MTEQLFPDLPEQPAPLTRESDEHWLTICTRCAGTGREECPYGRNDLRQVFWDPACRQCRGGGRVLIHVGPVRDG